MSGGVSEQIICKVLYNTAEHTVSTLENFTALFVIAPEYLGPSH